MEGTLKDIEQIKKTLKDHGYEYKHIIGRGGFSSVHLCYSLKYKFDFAVKITEKQRLTQDEYNTLIALNHPRIIKLYDAFEDDQSQYLVMEYCMNQTIDKKGKLTYEQFVYYSKQLLDVLSFCHSRNIAHRDIKPENILLDKYENIKLADFGIAKFFRMDKSAEKCGTIKYFAPEMFQSEEICPFKTDIWALGITFFMMATGFYPFQGKTKSDIKRSILIGELNFSKYNVDKRIRFIILKMIQTNPQLRLSADKLLNLSMFSEKVDKKSSYPCFDLNKKRITSTRSMNFDTDLSSTSTDNSQGSEKLKHLHSFKNANLFVEIKRTGKRHLSKPV